MKGLEIKEYLFSEIYAHNTVRLDSEFLTKIPKYSPQIPCVPIGQILTKLQYGISIEMNEEERGTPIYRMNEIDNMFCGSQTLKYAKMPQSEVEKFKLNDREALFNRTNSLQNIGKTALYRAQGNKDFVFASYLVRLISNETYVLPEYLVAFLNSKFGVLEIRRRVRQSINQANINLGELKEILIPLLSLRFQSTIKLCFEKAFSKYQQSFQEMAMAEETLNKYIESDAALSKNKPSYQVETLANSFLATGRLDAEFYNMYSASMSFNAKGLPFAKLDELCVFISRITKIPFSNLRPSDVLIHASGKSSVVAFNENLSTNKSTTVLRLNEEINPYYLMLFLNSMPGQIQIKKWQSGSSQTLVLNPRQIAQFEIPILDRPIQEKIAEQIQSNHRLFIESERLQNLIKTTVELAIEEGERAAENFLALQLQNRSL